MMSESRAGDDGGTDHVGPIVFADEDARRQLVDEGDVVTFRTSERTTGDTWWRESRTGPKQGDCRVELEGPVDPSDKSILMAYYREAGFESVEAWQDAIEELNGELSDGYLYRVTIPQQTLVTDGGWPEGDRCPMCGELMDVGAVGNPGETITWQQCDDCRLGWGPFTGYVDLDGEEEEVSHDAE